jgi:predicted dehydrogenase
MTNIGYIGLDHHHRDPYLASIESLPLSVTATADTNRSAESLDIGDRDVLGEVPFYTDYERLLDESDVDIVWLTLSNRDTPEVIRAAVERDIDVFTEKPAARTAAELDAIAASVRESDALVGFSYAWRGHPLARKLRELAGNGFFGDLLGFDLRFVASQLTTRDTSHYLFDRDASRGGIVQWLGVHWIDLLPWILNDPIKRVHAHMRSTIPTVGIEDGATLQFETATGALGTLTCGYYLREDRYDTNIRIYGEDGRSKWCPIRETFSFEGEAVLELDSNHENHTSTPSRITHEYTPTPGYGGNWGLDFFKQFLAARRGEAAIPADFEDALCVLRVLDAAYESAESGGWVRV